MKAFVSTSAVRLLPSRRMIRADFATEGKYVGAFAKSVITLYTSDLGARTNQVASKHILLIEYISRDDRDSYLFARIRCTMGIISNVRA